jgi:hypothetical protein
VRLIDAPGDVSWLEPMTELACQTAVFITTRHPAATPPDGDGQDDEAWRGVGYTLPAPAGQDGYAGPIRLFLTDAGYWSEANITVPGPPRLIATGKDRTLEHTARSPASPDSRPPGAPGQEYRRHDRPAATEDGITAYRHRGHTPETPERTEHEYRTAQRFNSCQ